MTHPASTEDAVRVRADLITAVVLVALGLAVVYFSWTMDRLEVRRIHPATIPGLVPLILGGALTLCGSLLFFRSVRLDQPGAGAPLVRTLVSWSAIRVATALGLALVYTLLLVGNLPFWLASSLFVFTFITLFETVLADHPGSLVRTLIWAGFVALIGGLGVYVVFDRIFLVRLP